MTRCLGCWRDAEPHQMHCHTCTKGEGLGKASPIKPWDGSHPPPKEEKQMDAKALTIWEAQLQQPWAVAYGQYKHEVTSAVGQLKHAIFHAQKSLGKLASILEKLDHSDSSWLSDEAMSEAGDLAADLVSASLRVGNIVGRSVAHSLVRRVKEKNGNGYGEPLPENQRARFGAMICK
jgi:hypothetical protein